MMNFNHFFSFLNKKGKNMTINEIAALAGVSRATVSRYLNNGYISKEKKERLRIIIEETGYRPASCAQMLRSKKTLCIGVIIPKINSDSIGKMVAGISRKLSESGYQLLLACTNNDEKKELNYLNLFKENNVDGIILLGTIFTEEHREILSMMSVPIVILAQNIPGCSCIYSDDYHAAFEMGKLLCKKGKNFAMVGVTEKDRAAGLQRKAGFLDALKESGKETKNLPIYVSDFSLESGKKECKKLLSEHPYIDTIFCATDTIAVGALLAAREAGLKVPDDIQIAGIGDNSLGEVSYPPITTVRFFYDEAGYQAANMLLKHIKTPMGPVEEQIQLNFELIERDSTK